jgi:hypothetical protein
MSLLMPLPETNSGQVEMPSLGSWAALINSVFSAFEVAFLICRPTRWGIPLVDTYGAGA